MTHEPQAGSGHASFVEHLRLIHFTLLALPNGNSCHQLDSPFGHWDRI